MFRLKILIILTILCSISIFAQHDTQDSGSKNLTAQQWREDLRYFAEQMPKVHNNLFFKMSKKDFDAAVANLDKKIPNLERHEIVLELMRITAMVGDGHTRLRAEREFGAKGAFPVKFYWFEDGLFVQSAAKEYENLVGGKVVKIGNEPVEKALEKAMELTAADNIMGKKAMSPIVFSVPEAADALGFSDRFDSLSVTVEKNGKTQTVAVKSSGQLSDLFRTPESWVDAQTGEMPLYLKQPENNYWYQYLPDKKLFYVKYNAVQNKEDESIADFFKKVYEFTEKNPVEKFVIDMRNNDGGNNSLNRPIYLGLIKSKLNEKGKAFAIIGRGTFSAAQNGVNKLEELTNITFVGEPTAAHPNHYGDARPITLPNSKLVVQASTLWWQDRDPRDNRPWTAPEIAAEMTFEDYKAGRDPALEAIFNYKSSETYTSLINEAKDISVFIKKFREFKSNPQNKFVDTQIAINRFGYNLIREKRLDEAIEVFKLNVEYYPNAANVYDSLGEAYMLKGNKELAIKNYEKALGLSPDYPSAVEALKKLKTGN